MSAIEILGLADVGGVLCVTYETTDWKVPEFYKLHWPTIGRTADVLRYFQVDSLDALIVEQSMPGEYAISERGRSWYRTRLALVNGAATQSVKIDRRPYPAPKRAKSPEYRDGRWHKILAGKWCRV